MPMTDHVITRSVNCLIFLPGDEIRGETSPLMLELKIVNLTGIKPEGSADIMTMNPQANLTEAPGKCA